MRARVWAGEAWLPVGWPAGNSNREQAGQPHDWRRIVFGDHPQRTLRRVLVWATAAILTFHLALVPMKVVGASMTPTYRDGAVNFINKLAYLKANPQRGDVVVLHDGEDLIVKRIIAVPGETVELERGIFYINGVALHDQFSAHRVNWEFDSVKLGPDDYFVIGDNRVASVFGKFSKNDVVGKVVFQR